MKRILLIIALLQCFSGIVFSQTFLTMEQEREIKLSDNYYWEEGNDYDVNNAYKTAIIGLMDIIMLDSACQNNNREDILKIVENKSQFSRINQKGMACVLVWISKNNLFVTENQQSFETQEPIPPQQVDVNDAVLSELIKCKDCREVNQLVNRYGWIKGRINSSEGFAHPELCFVAVFDTSGAMVALLDKGDSNRMDLMSGQTIKNPEFKFQNEGYYLWYLQQK